MSSGINNTTYFTDSAIDAALDCIDQLPFETLEDRRATMRAAIQAAIFYQIEIMRSPNAPEPVIDKDGLLIGDWVKGSDDKWHLSPILYD